MRPRAEKRLPADLEQVAERLRDRRPEASPTDLHRMKARAMSQAEAHRSGPARRPNARPRLVSVVVVAGLLLGGTGGVIAATGGVPGSGSDNGSAGVAQYESPQSGVLGETQGAVPGGSQGARGGGSQDESNESASSTQGVAAGSVASDASSGSGSGELAFTGLDLGVLVAVALALLVASFAVRRLSGPPRR
jgi:hypothetical protein